MARLFKPTIVRYIDSEGRRCKKGDPGARKKKVKSKTWRGKYRDAEGIRTRRAVQQQLQQVPPVLMLVAAEDDESGTVVVADLRLRMSQVTGRTQVERIPTWNIDPTDLLLR